MGSKSSDFYALSKQRITPRNHEQSSFFQEIVSVIYALNPVLHLPSLLETDDLLIESQFFLPISQNTGLNSMPNEVPLVSEVDEVVVDG